MPRNFSQKMQVEEHGFVAFETGSEIAEQEWSTIDHVYDWPAIQDMERSELLTPAPPNSPLEPKNEPFELGMLGDLSFPELAHSWSAARAFADCFRSDSQVLLEMLLDSNGNLKEGPAHEASRGAWSRLAVLQASAEKFSVIAPVLR